MSHRQLDAFVPPFHRLDCDGRVSTELVSHKERQRTRPIIEFAAGFAVVNNWFTEGGVWYEMGEGVKMMDEAER